MLKEEVLRILTDIGIKSSLEILEIPTKEEFGDISFPCFSLAKEMRKNPAEVATEISRKIQVSKYPLIFKVESRDSYVNFFFYWEKVAERLLKQIFEPLRLKRERVMIEFSQPNPVHPMHIGHARSTFLGDALANLLSYLGCKALRANYMNDVGLQVAKLVTAYSLWGRRKRPKGKPDLWLWQYYVKFHERAKDNPLLEEKAHETLRKFELEKDEKTIKTWKKIVRWCVKGFEETYKNIGIKFNVWFYETNFRGRGKEIVNKALLKGVAIKSPEGTIITNLKQYGLPDTVLIRSDGTGLYITSDLALTVHKFERYKLDSAVWVVMSHQDLYFKQLFKILELLEYEWSKRCYHFSYEAVKLPGGKMSSREGKGIMLDEVLKELMRLAYNEVNKRNPKTTRRKKMKIAKAVAVGALKYAILKIEPQNTITFDWKQMLSLEGNTAPYIQYAHTRCSGILRKAKNWKKVFRVQKLEEEEKKLIKQLSQFHSVLAQAAKEMKPHYLCNYMYELATVFNHFYEKCPVLKCDETTRNFRLTLVEATRNVLKDCLKIIGVKPLEKM
jgi:arginyl-tRNA synthetase